MTARCNLTGMAFQVVGAGAPRTGTTSLRQALERLLHGPCLHMSAIPGHPFDLGAEWDQALAGSEPDWAQFLSSFVAAVDWPASAFWRQINAAHPDAIVVLSMRSSAQSWYASMDATILPVARRSLGPDWTGGRGLTRLLERFAGSPEWDDRELLMAAYERDIAAVRQTVRPDRLVEWHAEDGWYPLCQALGVPVPDEPFPWLNKRQDW